MPTAADSETAAQRRQIHNQWSKPLAARVVDGYAIENVRLVDIRPNGQIELTCNRNRSRFRPGDILNLNRGNPFFQPDHHPLPQSQPQTIASSPAVQCVLRLGQQRNPRP